MPFYPLRRLVLFMQKTHNTRPSLTIGFCKPSDAKKMYYYRGLSEWEHEKGYLTDTCLDGQDTFRKFLAMFDIEA